MLSITGLHNFYFLPHFHDMRCNHDMRCKARRISDMIRVKYHRDPLNGDVYVFMSKDQTKVKMIHYENHAFYVHEKSFVKGYKFVKVLFREGTYVYKIEWKSLVAVLESPVIKSISLQ